MSKIKFRAWDNELKVMLTGHNQYGEDEPNFSTEYSSAGAFTRLWEALARFEESKRFVLMQYTGLLDKNGNEIYEGDIVQCGNYWTRKVEWGIIEDSEMGDPIGVGYSDSFEIGEVIGNIWENPELIKEI